MPGLYVYAIAGAPLRPRARGAFGRPLHSVMVGKLHVLVEPSRRAPRPTIARLRAQGRVIARLVARGADVLPVRFGTHVAGEDELRTLVEARRAQLGRALRRVRGRVQMTVQVRLEAPAGESRPVQVGGGAAYLRALAQKSRAARRSVVLRSIEAATRPYVRASRTDVHETPIPMARVHHLVPRGRIAAYVKAVDRAVGDRQVAAVAVSGPWAPFAFAEVG